MHAGASREIACNVVKRVRESNLRNVRNLDGFTRSILRRIEESGIDVGASDLSALDPDVAEAIMGHVEGRAVEQSDFTTVQVCLLILRICLSDFTTVQVRHDYESIGFFVDCN